MNYWAHMQVKAREKEAMDGSMKWWGHMEVPQSKERRKEEEAMQQAQLLAGLVHGVAPAKEGVAAARKGRNGVPARWGSQWWKRRRRRMAGGGDWRWWWWPAMEKRGERGLLGELGKGREWRREEVLPTGFKGEVRRRCRWEQVVGGGGRTELG